MDRKLRLFGKKLFSFVALDRTSVFKTPTKRMRKQGSNTGAIISSFQMVTHPNFNPVQTWLMRMKRINDCHRKGKTFTSESSLKSLMLYHWLWSYHWIKAKKLFRRLRKIWDARRTYIVHQPPCINPSHPKEAAVTRLAMYTGKDLSHLDCHVEKRIFIYIPTTITVCASSTQPHSISKWYLPI